MSGMVFVTLLCFQLLGYLFYLYAYQINPVCVVCVVTSDWGLLFAYWVVTKVTSPND